MKTTAFAARLRSARRILIIEFGGLGDHLHSLPALWLLRQNCPQARIEMLVGGGGVPVFRGLAPWIDEVTPYERGDDRTVVARLRAQGYDGALQLMQSNRGTVLLALSGARAKLLRRTDENKPWWWQPLFVDCVVQQPYHQFPMYRQRWNCLRQAGFEGPEPQSLADGHAQIDQQLRRSRGIAEADDHGYVHLSSSATDDLRDLPPAQMLALWEALHQALPGLRFVVTASATPRGRSKLEALLGQLSFQPWKVFAGDLDIPAFAAVVQGAALHVGPDSGGLHVARIAGTPSVSWFRPNHHMRNWLPDEAGHIALVAPESRSDGLYGIATETLVDAARQLVGKVG